MPIAPTIRRRGTSRSWLACLAVVAFSFSSGCESYFSARAARQAYRACLEDPERSKDECEDEREHANSEFDRYEQEAQRAWGCENTPDRCRDHPGP